MHTVVVCLRGERASSACGMWVPCSLYTLLSYNSVRVSGRASGRLISVDIYNGSGLYIPLRFASAVECTLCTPRALILAGCVRYVRSIVCTLRGPIFISWCVRYVRSRSVFNYDLVKSKIKV